MKGTAEIFVPYSECCREPKTALQEKKKRHFGEEICAFILREGLESWKRF